MSFAAFAKTHIPRASIPRREVPKDATHWSVYNLKPGDRCYWHWYGVHEIRFHRVDTDTDGYTIVRGDWFSGNSWSHNGAFRISEIREHP